VFRWRRSLLGLGASFPRFTLGQKTSTPAPLWILTGVALFAMAAYAAPVLIPLAAAIILYYLFAPLKRRLDRRGVSTLPLAVGAPLGIVVLLFAGFTFLAGPVSGWLERAPSMVGRLQQQVDGLMGPVERMREATGQVEKIARPGNGQPGPPEVTVKPRSLLERIFGGLSDFVVYIAATLMLLFYLLARSAPPERAMIGFLTGFAARRRAYRAVREAEADLSRYLQTVALINAGLGAMLAAAFHLIGLPGGIVLGAMVGLLNFVPLLGPVASVVLTLVAGLAAFDSFGEALIAPGIVAVVHTIETNFVTPAILGKRLTLDPFLVVLALLLGTWLWGIGGALLAVPLLLFTVAAWRAYILRAPPKALEAAKEEDTKAAPHVAAEPVATANATVAPPVGVV
jgi:predicted PurR-regulated permease PerM